MNETEMKIMKRKCRLFFRKINYLAFYLYIRALTLTLNLDLMYDKKDVDTLGVHLDRSGSWRLGHPNHQSAGLKAVKDTTRGKTNY